MDMVISLFSLRNRLLFYSPLGGVSGQWMKNEVFLDANNVGVAKSRYVLLFPVWKRIAEDNYVANFMGNETADVGLSGLILFSSTVVDSSRNC